MPRKSNTIDEKNNRVSSHYNNSDYQYAYYNLKKLYLKIKHIRYVPDYKFQNFVVSSNYLGTSLEQIDNISKDTKVVIKEQIIEFIQELFKAGIAHRDLHIKNICWDGTQIWVIDWEFITEHSPPDITKHYDLVGEGLESPLASEHMNVFKESIFSIANWLTPLTISIKEFRMDRQKLIEEQLVKTTGYSNYKQTH